MIGGAQKTLDLRAEILRYVCHVLLFVLAASWPSSLRQGPSRSSRAECRVLLNEVYHLFMFCSVKRNGLYAVSSTTQQPYVARVYFWWQKVVLDTAYHRMDLFISFLLYDSSSVFFVAGGGSRRSVSPHGLFPFLLRGKRRSGHGGGQTTTAALTRW